MHFSEKVTLLGAGRAETGVLTEALMFAPRLVAADGGAKNAVKIGQMPDFVVGDLDSVDARTLAKIPADRLIRVTEQESTDFEKCLSLIDAPLILAVGFLGGRIDHQLASFNALTRHEGPPVILLNARDLCFHLPSDLTLRLGAGTRVSLFPMAPVTGRSDGLKWPIGDIAFAPAGRIGTSNISTHDSIRLRMDGPGMLAIMPRAALGEVVRCLAP